jgi:FkbM family methyltransferase
MKIFIDLGAYTGDTIIAAFRNNEGYEKYIAFEPDADNVKKLRENLQFLPNVEIVEAAAYVKNEVVQFHKHIDEGVRQDAKEGGTLERTKKNVSQDNVAMVTGIDFAEYLQKNVREQDHVVLKIDIEGSEYDLLQHLIDTNAISLVDELYCEWHKHKVSGKDEIHKQLVAKLQSLGFNITGENSHDEFSQIKRNLLLSIVIPTFNRSSVVCSLLKSLHTQTDPSF